MVIALPANDSLVPRFTPEDVSPVADMIAAGQAFKEYRERRSDQTLRAHDADIACLVEYLASMHVQVMGDLATDPEAWRGIRHGLVDGFVHWQLQKGFALATINRRLATVKRYLGLAMRSGAITAEQFVAVQQVKGYRQAEAQHMDSRRAQTRQEKSKKAAPIFLTDDQYEVLWQQPATLQGRRDAAMMAIFLGLGLRCGELAALHMEQVDMERRQFTFYRPKVHKTQTHKFPDDHSDLMHEILDRYLAERPTKGNLWYHIRRDGSAVERMLTQREIYRIVSRLGGAIGVQGLSPHDLRHTWATRAALAGTPLEALREAGGWASLEMPLRYIKTAKIANEGVKLKSA